MPVGGKPTACNRLQFPVSALGKKKLNLLVLAVNRFFYNVTKTWHIFKSQLACKLQFLRGACWNAALFVTFSSGQSISFQIAVAEAALKVWTTGNPYWLHNCCFRCKACPFCAGIRNKYAPIKLHLNQVCARYGHIWGSWRILMATFFYDC